MEKEILFFSRKQDKTDRQFSTIRNKPQKLVSRKRNAEVHGTKFSTNRCETDLKDIKLNQLFVLDFRGMSVNLKQIELLNCHIEKLHVALIFTTPINGNSHQIFLNQQNAPGIHAERTGGIFYFH